MWRVEQELFCDTTSSEYYIMFGFGKVRDIVREETAESTSGEPSHGQGWLSRPGARLSGALQAERRQPRSRRAPQDSDQSSTDFVPFPGGYF